MNIANLKIGIRPGLGSGIVLLLLAGVATSGINGMSRSNDALHNEVVVNVVTMGERNDS